MTKQQLTVRIAQDAGLTQLQAQDVVQRTFDEITHALVTEGRIELRNFGVFVVRRRAPRKARNPRTGEKVMTPARNVVTFKPGRVMRRLVPNADTDQAAHSARQSPSKGVPER